MPTTYYLLRRLTYLLLRPLPLVSAAAAAAVAAATVAVAASTATGVKRGLSEGGERGGPRNGCGDAARASCIHDVGIYPEPPRLGFPTS